MFSVAPVAPRLWWHDTSWRPWVGNLVKEETTPTDEGVVTTWGRVVRPAAPRKSFSS